MDPDLEAAYRQTHFTVDGGVDPAFVLRIDQASAELLAMYQAHGVGNAAFLTAWNPGSRRLSEDVNGVAQASMEAELCADGLTLIAGVGVDPTGKWPGEPSVLVLGITLERAQSIGREFGQNAIVWMDHDGVPRLVLLRR